MAGPRVVRAPRGNKLTCGSWLTEAPFRMIQNNLDPEVAEHPDQLVVYGGIGKAARNWEAFDADSRRADAPERRRDRCWCSRASRSACSRRTWMRRAC